MKRTVVLGPIIALTLLAGGAAAQLPMHHAHANLPIHTSKSATTKLADGTQHLANSLRMFEHLLALVRSVDEKKVEGFRQARDYEALDLYIMEHLLGK